MKKIKLNLVNICKQENNSQNTQRIYSRQNNKPFKLCQSVHKVYCQTFRGNIQSVHKHTQNKHQRIKKKSSQIKLNNTHSNLYYLQKHQKNKKSKDKYQSVLSSTLEPTYHKQQKSTFIDSDAAKDNYNPQKIKRFKKYYINEQNQSAIDSQFNQLKNKLVKTSQILKQIKKIKGMNKSSFHQNQQSVNIKPRQNIKTQSSTQYQTPKFNSYPAFFDNNNTQKQIQKNISFATNNSPKLYHQYSDSLTSMKSKLSIKHRLSLNINNFCSEQNKTPTITDFLVNKCVGQGKFGKVYLVTHKKTNFIYAMKKIEKQTIKKSLMLDQFILQIKLQCYIDHPNLVKMYSFFDDLTHIYFIMEYMEDGSLFSLLRKKKTMQQKQSSVYMKQITDAVQYLHENGIAHRDIKPENIVISNDICKLTDFGWSTICKQRRKTYCGTFDYAAPQILQGNQYDMSVDLWCLGVLLYELLIGKAPFYHVSRKQTFQRIINVQNKSILPTMQKLSKNAQSFIQNLLRKNPQERLIAQNLQFHPFLIGIQK